MQRLREPGTMRAFIGVLLILSINAGAVALLNIMIPEIIEDMHISKVEISYVIMIASLGAFLFGLAGTKLINVFTPKWLQFIGCAAACLYMFGIGAAPSYSILLFVGVIGGVVMAFGTFTPLAAICGQFWGEDSGKMYGLIAGIEIFIVAGYTFVMGQLLYTFDYRTVFFIAAGLCALGMVLNLLFIKQPTEDQKARLEKLGRKKLEEKGLDKESRGIMVRQSLKTASLYLFFLGLMAGAIITSGVSSYGTTLFTSIGSMDTSTAAALMSAYMFFGGIHFLYCGFFSKKFGSRSFVIFMYIAIIAGLFLLIGWAAIQVLPVAIAGLFLTALIKPVNSLPALLVPDLFGRKDYASFISLTMGVYYAGVCISQLSTAQIMQSVGGSAAFVYLAIMAIISLAVLVLAHVFSPYRKMLKKGAVQSIE